VTNQALRTHIEPKKIYLTQKDFRELQLAKAAVATACELLLKNAGIKSVLPSVSSFAYVLLSLIP
jgi:uncharacterized 2Fe-2S/4Fe-4S cluster protein (DUF4445 family)